MYDRTLDTKSNINMFFFFSFWLAKCQFLICSLNKYLSLPVILSMDKTMVAKVLSQLKSTSSFRIFQGTRSRLSASITSGKHLGPGGFLCIVVYGLKFSLIPDWTCSHR